MCTECGLMFSDKIEYVVSYNHNFSKRRPPVYSRQKRFYHFIREHPNEIIRQHTEDIIMFFTHLELFYQIVSEDLHNRKYFFNRRVVLAFILYYLDIDVGQELRTLKDKTRVMDQFCSMKRLTDRYL